MSEHGNAGLLPERLRALGTVPGGLHSAVTRNVLDYWRALCPNPTQPPHRRAVDPIDIGARLLPHLFLCEFQDDGNILIRLQGSYLVDQAGLSMTGKYVDESTFGVNAPAVRDVYRGVRSTRRPIATRETVLTSLYRTILTEVLYLPLLGDDGVVAYVFGALDRLDQQHLPDSDFHAAEWATIQLVEGV